MKKILTLSHPFNIAEITIAIAVVATRSKVSRIIYRAVPRQALNPRPKVPASRPVVLILRCSLWTLLKTRVVRAGPTPGPLLAVRVTGSARGIVFTPFTLLL